MPGVYEPKQDGYRIIALIDGSARHPLFHVRTELHPEVSAHAEALKWLKLKEAVFDGEVLNDT